MSIFEGACSIDGHSNKRVLTCEERIKLVKCYIQKIVTPELILKNTRMAVFNKPDDIKTLLTFGLDPRRGCSLTVRTPVISLDICSVDVPGIDLYFIDDVLATYACSVDILEDAIKVRLNNTPPEVVILCVAESELGIGAQVFDIEIENPKGFKPHDFDSSIIAGLNYLDLCAAPSSESQLRGKAIQLELQDC